MKKQLMTRLKKMTWQSWILVLAFVFLIAGIICLILGK